MLFICRVYVEITSTRACSRCSTSDTSKLGRDHILELKMNVENASIRDNNFMPIHADALAISLSTPELRPDSFTVSCCLMQYMWTTSAVKRVVGLSKWAGVKNIL